MIYFIRNPINDTIKIGVSKQVEHQLKTLRLSSGLDLKLAGCIELPTFESDKKFKLQLQGRFSKDRTIGDWFKNTPALQSLIDESPVIGTTRPTQMVRIRERIHKKLVEYKETSGIPITTAVDFAITQFLISKGINVND